MLSSRCVKSPCQGGEQLQERNKIAIIVHMHILYVGYDNPYVMTSLRDSFIFPTLNKSRIDQVFLECASSKVPMSLIGLLMDKDVMVGAIDGASYEAESPEQVAATIAEATKYLRYVFALGHEF